MRRQEKTLDLFSADTKAIYTKAAATGREPPSLLQIGDPMPDDATFEIIKLMRIPGEKSTAAVEMLRVPDSMLWHREWGGSLFDNMKHFGRISALCDRLMKELDMINDDGRRFLEMPRPNNDEELFSLRAYRTATQWLARNVTFVKRKRAAHRPKGTVKNPELKALILDLHRVAEKSGGRLTLGLDMRTRRPNGSLPKILKIFHRHFPKIIPAEVPYHTLHRMRCAAVDDLAREVRMRDAGPPPPAQVNPKSTA